MNCELFEKKVVIWLKTKLESAKKSGFVVGLSGGIDSAVVSLLCQKAGGTKNILCLIIPCQ